MAYRYRAESFRMYSLYGRATILCSYMVWPYAGQSHRDGKVENLLNFKIYLTCIVAL